MALIDTSFIRTAEYFWTQRTLALVLEIIMLIITSVYLYDFSRFARKMVHSRKSSTKSSRDIITSGTRRFRQCCHLATLCTLITYCLQGGHYVLNAWSVYPDSWSCDIIEKISVMLYHLGKTFVYTILILRVKIAFHGSTYMTDGGIVQYGVYMIDFLLISFFIVAMVGDVMEITGTLWYLNEADGLYYCLLDEMATWGIVFFGVLDFVLSVLCVSVFIYPLRIMLKSHSDPKIIDLIEKYAALSTIAVLSTFCVVLIVAVMETGVLSLWDNVVNSVCILFMSSWYQKSYWKIKFVFCRVCCCRNTATLKAQTEKKMSAMISQTPHPTMTQSPSNVVGSGSRSGTELNSPTGSGMIIDKRDTMSVIAQTQSPPSPHRQITEMSTQLVPMQSMEKQQSNSMDMKD